MVARRGIEPLRLTTKEPKSFAAALTPPGHDSLLFVLLLSFTIVDVFDDTHDCKEYSIAS